MWPFTRKATPAPQQKASAVGGMMVLNQGRAVWSKRDFEAFAKEGYEQNVVVGMSVSRVVDAIAQVPFETWRGDTQVETETELSALWENPNPDMSRAEFIRSVVSNLIIAGNSYIEASRGIESTRELWPLRPDRMSVVPDQEGRPVAYEYKVGGRKYTFRQDPLRPIIKHIKTFHPTDDFYGLSMLEPALRDIDIHNEARAHLMSLLQNQATPRGALMAPEGSVVADEERQRILAMLERDHSGGMNAGRSLFLEGGLQWKDMGLSPTDLKIVETMNAAARNIAIAIGVPPQMLGIPGDSTYSNYQEARISFYEDTVIPLLDLVTSEFNSWLEPEFGLTLKPNLDGVPAMVDKKRGLWDMADKSADLTINERRELKGYPPLDGDRGNVLAAEVLQARQMQSDIKSVQDRLAYG